MNKIERIAVGSGAIFFSLALFILSGDSLVDRPIVENITPTPISQQNFKLPEKVEEYLREEQIIHEYYSRLNQKKIEDAFQMYDLSMMVDWETYSSWYKDIESVAIREIVELGKHRYLIWIDYKDKNGWDETYIVTMEISETGEIITRKSELKNYFVQYINKSAWVTRKNGFDYLMLEKDGRRQIIDQVNSNEENPVLSSSLYKPLFSPRGRYLVYEIGGWEYFGVKIYDTNTGIKKVYDSAYQRFFSNDDKYVAICGKNQFGSDAVNGVVKLPEHKIIFKPDNINDEYGYYLSLDCSFDEIKNEFVFILSDPWKEFIPQVKKEIVTLIFNLNSGKYREE